LGRDVIYREVIDDGYKRVDPFTYKNNYAKSLLCSQALSRVGWLTPCGMHRAYRYWVALAGNFKYHYCLGKEADV